MKFLFPLHKEIAVGLIGDIIKCIDMNCIVTFFAFMDEGSFICRVMLNVNISAIAGQKSVTIIEIIR